MIRQSDIEKKIKKLDQPSEFDGLIIRQSDMEKCIELCKSIFKELYVRQGLVKKIANIMKESKK